MGRGRGGAGRGARGGGATPEDDPDVQAIRAKGVTGPLAVVHGRPGYNYSIEVENLGALRNGEAHATYQRVQASITDAFGRASPQSLEMGTSYVAVGKVGNRTRLVQVSNVSRNPDGGLTVTSRSPLGSRVPLETRRVNIPEVSGPSVATKRTPVYRFGTGSSFNDTAVRSHNASAQTVGNWRFLVKS